MLNYLYISFQRLLCCRSIPSWVCTLSEAHVPYCLNVQTFISLVVTLAPISM